MILTAIPSPHNGVLRLGPIALHAYGVCIALGVLAAVWLSSRRWEARGGKAEDITTLALWGVPFGVLGARIYHVATDPELYRSDPLRAFAVWDGGLGIWGGIGLGVVAGAVVARRRGFPLPPLLDAVAPGLALAQAIGRWGNYFNQELFGRPTHLPWGIHIDIANRPPGYENATTFHPTFLYESLWDLLLCGSLLVIDKKWHPRPGRIFLLYVAGYTFARFFIEQLRVDFAHRFLGLRLNDWTSLVVFVAAVSLLVVSPKQDEAS